MKILALTNRDGDRVYVTFGPRICINALNQGAAIFSLDAPADAEPLVVLESADDIVTRLGGYE